MWKKAHMTYSRYIYNRHRGDEPFTWILWNIMFPPSPEDPNFKKKRGSYPRTGYTYHLGTVQWYLQLCNDNTAPSPSRLHYSHYTSSCDSDDLAQVHLLSTISHFQVGTLLSRWNRSLHCMIEKQRKPSITKLIIAQLYEADFNPVFKNF